MLNLRVCFSEEGFRIRGVGKNNSTPPLVNIKYDYREEDFYSNCKNNAHLMNQLHWVVFNDMMEKIIELIDSLDQDSVKTFIGNVFLDIESSSKIIEELNNPGWAKGQTTIDSFALYSIEYHINERNNYGLICDYKRISKEKCQKMLDLDGVLDNGSSTSFNREVFN
jgi:hypothetical protein